jgi:glycosyltransferase involved in cell wall biosynthesis
MKILQVSHGLPPRENAGVELYTFYLSKAFMQRDHQVHVFCREENPDMEEFSSSEEEMDGVRVTRVVNNLTRIPDPRAYYDNHLFDETFSWILYREKPDIVHFQHFIALSANLIRITKDEGYPVILTLHDFFLLCHRTHLLKRDHRVCSGPLYGLQCVRCLNDYYLLGPQDVRTNFFLKVKDFLPFPFIKWTKRFFIPPKYLEEGGYEVFHRYRFMYEILKYPDVILTPSHFVKDLFLKYYPFAKLKTKVLPLGIPTVASPEEPRKREGRIRFCYFGNILPTKGLHFLVDAFKKLPKGKGHLTIFGGRAPSMEAYYDQLREQANGYSIDFRAPFKRAEISKALRDQDVVILPSICPESFSFVIREANSLGLPVIASRMGAIPEAVQEGVNGLLFEPGNIEDLRRCMLKLIESPGLVQEMALKMPKVKWMAEHALELEKIYRGIIEGRG